MYAHQRSLFVEQQVSSASFSVAFGSSLERIAQGNQSEIHLFWNHRLNNHT